MRDRSESAGRHDTVPLDLSRPAGPDDPRRSRQVEARRPHSGRAPVGPPGVPRQREPVPDRRRAPLAVAAVINTFWAAAVVVVPILALALLAPAIWSAGPSLGAARIGLAMWLLSLGTPLSTSVGTIALAPLGIGAFALWRVMRAGVHTTRAIGARGNGRPRHAVVIGAACGLVYGVLAGLVGWFVNSDVVGVAPLRAALQGLVLGGVAGILGAIKATGSTRTLARRVPRVVRDGTRTGVVAALLVIGAGAGVIGLAIATHYEVAGKILEQYKPGGAGNQAGVTLASLVLAPNFAVWAASYLVGPGFALGTDSVVRASGVAIGGLPAIPAFAALPTGPLTGVATMLLGVPVLAGMTAGWLLVRRRLRPRQGLVPVVHWGHVLTSSIVAGPVAGVLLGIACLFSGGPLGDGKLAQIGPDALRVALVATGVITIGTVLGAIGTRAARGLGGLGALTGRPASAERPVEG
ncbi:hypothetical protein F4553_004960 [Allocatelliglobosispora scoriae]|uniref:Integral membrane protein n=1 Tax=Allocatelliglobosispora scoriae TaxID=643052 RepID=A0A841BY33_9ACTN|nr:DUF6350 family protein [Allocatelliglobosispora scoriae]MBB5871581.1 hypothetical protein [Allocatelliglobosispora scoriae]